MWLFNAFHDRPSPTRSCRRSTPTPAARSRSSSAGASIGAFNALAMVCRYPRPVPRRVCMSGTYAIERFIGGPFTDDLYFSSPLHFLPGLEGPALDLLRQRFVLLASGAGAWEDVGESWAAADVLGGRASPTASTTGAPTTSTTGRRGGRCCPTTSTSLPDALVRAARRWAAQRWAAQRWAAQRCAAGGPAAAEARRPGRRGFPSGLADQSSRRISQAVEHRVPGCGESDPLDAAVVGVTFTRDEARPIEVVQVVSQCRAADANPLGEIGLGTSRTGLDRQQPKPDRAGPAGTCERPVERAIHGLGRPRDLPADRRLPGDRMSIDAGSPDSLRNPCSPPAGTYTKSPGRPSIHREPSYNRMTPKSTKNASDSALWKWASGPLRSGPMLRYKP